MRHMGTVCRFILLSAAFFAALSLPAASQESADGAPPAADSVAADQPTVDQPTVEQPAAEQPAGASEFDFQSDVVIRGLEVSGNFIVDDGEILAAVKSQIDQPISPTLLEEDLDAIYDLGYFQEDVKAHLSEYEDGVKVIFSVIENQVVESVNIEGVDEELKAKLPELKSKAGKIFNHNDFDADVTALEDYFNNEGYFALIPDFQLDAGGNLTIKVRIGHVEDVRVSYMNVDEDLNEVSYSDEGKTKARVILREMKTQPGKVYNENVLKKDLQKIFNLGFFENINRQIEPSPTTQGDVIITVEVEEAKTGQLGFGAGFGSNTGLSGFLTYQERNLRGMGRRGDVKLEFGGKRNDFEIGYFEPWVDKKHTSLETSFFDTSTRNIRFAGIDNEDIEEQSRGGSVTVGRPLNDENTLFFGFRAEDTTVSVPSSQSSIYAFREGSTRTFTASFLRDTRDYIFDPTTGQRHNVGMEYNGGILGGDFDYQKVNADFRKFIPVRKKQTIGLRLSGGYATGGVPEFDLYEVGGVNTLRGYAENEFAGQRYVLANGEYRFNIAANLGAVLFGDAGLVWLDKDKLTSKAAFRSVGPRSRGAAVGAGMRLKIRALGVGPVRLDFAYQVKSGDTEFHFGIGHMF